MDKSPEIVCSNFRAGDLEFRHSKPRNLDRNLVLCRVLCSPVRFCTFIPLVYYIGSNMTSLFDGIPLISDYQSDLTSAQPEQIQAIDFFCGAGGMSCGLTRAKINVLAGIDIDADCRNTYEHDKNGIGAKFIGTDLINASLSDLEQRLGVEKREDGLIFAGCSPCQYWSKINTDKTKSARKKNLLERFGEFIDYYQPGYVLVENVPGLLTKKNEKVLAHFRSLLEELEYTYEDGIVDVTSYGVPQKRRRYLLIASRLGDGINLPESSKFEGGTDLRDFIGDTEKFPPVEAGHRDESDFMHTVSRLSNLNLRRIRATKKDGGGRLDWADDPELQIPAYKGKDDHFTDVYGRMRWDEPAPTITTRFNSLSNGRFGHPEQDRAISLREGATLQTFPEDYVFRGSLQGIARQIGNAVPPRMAKELGNVIIEHYAGICSNQRVSVKAS